MKRFIISLLLLLPNFFFTSKAADEYPPITFMSFNIRLASSQDGTNSWGMRAPAIIEMLEDQKPDVLCLQEAMFEQTYFLKDYTKDYTIIGTGKDKNGTKGDHMTILYRYKSLKVIKWDTFWLSDTPDKYSIGWGAEQARSATWALMQEKSSGKKFYVVNTHLDSEPLARENGLKLIIEKIALINKDNLPVVLAGVFNMEQDDPAMQILEGKMTNARQGAVFGDNSTTWHNWGKNKTGNVIDHIYYSGFQTCVSFDVVKKKYRDRNFISDHYPIKALIVVE